MPKVPSGIVRLNSRRVTCHSLRERRVLRLFTTRNVDEPRQWAELMAGFCGSDGEARDLLARKPRHEPVAPRRIDLVQREERHDERYTVAGEPARDGSRARSCVRHPRAGASCSVVIPAASWRIKSSRLRKSSFGFFALLRGASGRNPPLWMPSVRGFVECLDQLSSTSVGAAGFALGCSISGEPALVQKRRASRSRPRPAPGG